MCVCVIVRVCVSVALPVAKSPPLAPAKERALVFAFGIQAGIQVVWALGIQVVIRNSGCVQH